MSSDGEHERPNPLGTFHSLEAKEEDWLDNHHRQSFLDAVGTKGKVEGSAAELTRKTIVPAFLAQFYPSTTENERSEMSAVAYTKIYSYLINGKRPGSGSRKKKRSKAERVDVTYLWADSNPEIKLKLFTDYRAENGLPADKTIPVAAARKLICAAYHALSKEEKQDWERRAAALRVELAKPKVLQGEERLNFARRVPGDLKGLFREYEAQGVIITAHVAYQIEEVGTMEVTSVSSDAAKEYKATDGHADSVASYADWLRTQGKTIKRDIPVEMAYPDRQNECIPLIPEINYEKPPPVPVLRRIVRTAVSAINQRLGGCSQFPWTELQRAQMNGDFKFVDPERMPVDYPLIEPSGMNSDYALVWAKWLARPQNNEGDKSTWFIPTTVYTSSLNTPLVRTDHVSKRKVVRGNTEAWELKYNGWVEKCQMGGNIKFPDESREYEEYLRKQRSGRSRPHLLGLPCDSTFIPSPAFTDSDLSFVDNLMGGATATERDTVQALMKAVNEMYLHLPAKTTDGIFSAADGSIKKVLGLPSLFPSDPAKLPSVQDYLSAWVSGSFFAPPYEDIPVHSTVAFCEKWQHWMLHKGFLQHSESQTLIGGRSGTMCVVLGILKLTLSIGAILGKVHLPAAKPNGIDATRASQADWDRCFLWCRDWLKAVGETVTTLVATFSERTQGATSAAQASESDDPPSNGLADTEPSLVPPLSPLPTPSQPLKPRPRPKYITAPTKDASNDDVRSMSGAESEASDIYKEPENKQSDEESEEDPAIVTKAKAKRPVPVGKLTPIDVGPSPLEKLRNQFERTFGRSVYNGSHPPLTDIPLDSHPLGLLSEVRPTTKWSGTPYALAQQCVQMKKESKRVLAGFFTSSIPLFRPEDTVLAISATISAPLADADLTKLLLVNIQRQSWGRAKDLWATTQYQFRAFSELTCQLSELLVTVDNERKLAPAGVSTELRNHLVGLRRLAYQVHFVYQELHDLGVLSKHFFDLLPSGWESPDRPLSSSDLQTMADHLFEWSNLTAKLVRYHVESRAKTWSAAKIDDKKHPVPEPVWLSFGNPPSCELLQEAIASMSERMASLRKSPDDSANAKPSHAQDSGPASKDIEVDSESPSEEELRARQLLEGAGEDGGDAGEGSKEGLAEQVVIGIPGGGAEGDAHGETNGDTPDGVPAVRSPTPSVSSQTPAPTAKAGSTTHTKAMLTTGTTRSKPPRKRKSNPLSVEIKEPAKKSKPTKPPQEAAGRKSGEQLQETTTRRSSRTVKLTERARNA